jgi:anti-sigma regulatory factor (Ser/Thr protein kinase)
LRNSHADLPALGAWVSALLEGLGCGERDRFRIDLVLTEIVTNIIDSAFPDGGAHTIEVSLRSEGELISIEVVDRGVAFDPVAAKPAALALRLEDASPGGLGLRIVQRYSDSLAYERDGERNRLTLGFRRSDAGSAPRTS